MYMNIEQEVKHFIAKVASYCKGSSKLLKSSRTNRFDILKLIGKKNKFYYYFITLQCPIIIQNIDKINIYLT